MTFHIMRKQDLWCVDDPRHEVGGVFVDLASALRFVRQHQSAARIVVSAMPRDA
jgi:hypothetical protein